MSFDSIAQIGSQIVGIVILAAAAIKAAAPAKFRDHLAGLRLIPESWLNFAVAAVTGFEGAWGWALLIGLWPAFLPILSIVLLAALSGLTIWSVRAGRAKDCGCYGGFVQPSIGQSLGLNAVYAGLLFVAMIAGGTSAPTQLWKPASALAVGVAIAVAAELVRRTRPIAVVASRPPSPIRAGQPWTPSWAAGSVNEGVTEQIVSYLGPRCPYCRSWVRILNIAHESPSFPDVTGVVAESADDLHEFIRTTGIKFPVVTIPQPLMSTLTDAVPTTVAVESGVIREVWTGNASPTFFERFKRSFFPDAQGAEDG